ncbi:MAG: cupredoxin domain-containing protein [Acidimicrobiales bacterium]
MRRVVAIALPALLAVLAACGSAGAPATAGDPSARTVEVEMRDIAFAPTSVDVRAGEKVRFVFRNAGQVVHDAYIGDQAAQDAHEKDARMSHSDRANDANAVSVKPGATASITYTFDRTGQVIIGCHQPGHYTGGMKATVNIA